METSFKRVDLPSYWDRFYRWLTTSATLFEDKDIDIVDGDLRKILINAVIDGLKENFQLKSKEHYKIKEIDCHFPETTENIGGKVSFKFKISILDSASKRELEDLHYEGSQKSRDLSLKLKESISFGIHDEYDEDVEISITKWGFGSIKIGGSVCLSLKEMSDDTKNVILKVLEKQTSEACQHPFKVEVYPYYEIDKSKINFTFLATLTNEDLIAKRQEIEEKDNKWLIKNLKHELTKGLMLAIHFIEKCY